MVLIVVSAFFATIPAVAYGLQSFRFLPVPLDLRCLFDTGIALWRLLNRELPPCFWSIAFIVRHGMVCLFILRAVIGSGVCREGLPLLLAFVTLGIFHQRSPLGTR
jgi:hypothetical protein